jgi:hypothetical protein
MGRNAGRLAAAALSVMVAVPLSGCGKGKGPVTGTVTVDNRPIRSGQLTFLGADGTRHPTTIGFNGTYTIELPPGDYKVGVEGGGQSNAAKMARVPIPKAPTGMPPMKDPTGQVGGEPVDLAKEMQNPVVVPMRYRAPESSGLKVTTTGDGDTFDIPMKSKG